MNSQIIYLDYNSTTPVDNRVLGAMLPYFTEKFGNAASRTHAYGWIAEEAVKIARKQVAELINCIDEEIVFTSGATESINLAIKGVFEAYKNKGNHIVTVATEHHAVLDVCKSLERKGAEVTYLPVDANGLINLNELNSSINQNTILVSVMYANNETGVIQNINEIAGLVHSKGSIFFCDATQALGKVEVDVQKEGIDLMCLSAHKIYGPKGVGALYKRRRNPRVTLMSQMVGGGHERGLRSGTLNVPGIVGLGKACEIIKDELFVEQKRIRSLRDFLEIELLQGTGGRINGAKSNRLSNTSNITFSGIKADALTSKLKNIAISTGSACSSALIEPSHVLKAMGLTDEEAYASIRISLGRQTTRPELLSAIAAIRNSFHK